MTWYEILAAAIGVLTVFTTVGTIGRIASALEALVEIERQRDARASDLLGDTERSA